MRKTGKKCGSIESALKFGTTSGLKPRIANLAIPVEAIPVEKERVPQQPARHSGTRPTLGRLPHENSVELSYGAGVTR